MHRYLPITAVLFILSGLLPQIQAEPQPANRIPKSLAIHYSQPLTADLGSEIDPAISPDGNWLLYASTRNDNYDIWIRKTGGGVPVPLTSHPADDFNPEWSPDGKRICFVSMRDDPEGDLYILNITLRNESPRALRVKTVIHEAGHQSNPSFSKNGKYIAYQDGAGVQGRIKLLNLSKKKSTFLTPHGFIQPDFSPVNNDIICIKVPAEDYGGDICLLHLEDLKEPQPKWEIVYESSFPASSPCWSPSGNSFCAVLVNRDLNLDGLLTPIDGQFLYRFNQVDSNTVARAISLGDASETYSCWASDGNIYHASDKSGSMDLWKGPAEGPVPRAPTAEACFNFALSIGREAEIIGRPLLREELLATLLAFERVRIDHPQARELGAKSMLESARLLNKSGEGSRALTFLKRLPRQYDEQTAVINQARIDYQIQVHSGSFQYDGKFVCENPSSLISNLTTIFDHSGQYPESSARALFLIAANHEQTGNIEQALDIYNQIVADYVLIGDYAAESLLRIASIYFSFGSKSEALDTYLREIKDFSDNIIPTEKAIENVVALQVGSDDPLAGLQNIIVRYPEIPALGAAAQKKIADIFAERGETEIALSEWERIRGYAIRHPHSYIRSLYAESLIESAELENQMGENLLAQNHLEEVEALFKDLKNSYYVRKARLLRISMLTERAEQLLHQSDWELAEVNFRKALRLSPNDVRLHRGRIASAMSLNHLKEVTQEYRELLEKEPDNAANMYALGLCLSYSGEGNSADIIESNELIQSAIALESDLVYGYTTLSYNYELQEKRNSSQSKTAGNFFKKIVHNLSSAVNSMGRLLTFRGASPPFQGYEKAIEALQLGISINDETTNPELEALLYLNLGNNYFNLGEFGYHRSLTAYIAKIKWDSSFTSLQQEANIREKMGQAASIIGKNDIALASYSRSLELYHNLKQIQGELRVLLRLAELHQVIRDEELSNSYYRQAQILADREGLNVPQSLWLENMALNALNMGDDENALLLTDNALESLPDNADIPTVEFYNPLVLEILGIPIPIMNFGYLGTGSPMSAIGLTQKDEILLNHSIAEDVYYRSKDPTKAIQEASERLAITINRDDPEGEAILWNILGNYFWNNHRLVKSKRCFIRSYDLCHRHGYRSGQLSALLNIASLELSRSSSDAINKADITDEMTWFKHYNIGYPDDIWVFIIEAVNRTENVSDVADLKNSIQRRFYQSLDPLDDDAEIPDQKLLSSLLILDHDQPFNAETLLTLLKMEIDKFGPDKIGFTNERLRLYRLYGRLCLKASNNVPESSEIDLFRIIDLQAEAIWVFESGINESRRLNHPADEILLSLDLSDFLYTLQDYSESAKVLVEGMRTAERIGDIRYLWRVFWRLGRITSCSTQLRTSLSNDISLIVGSHSADEWFDLAIDAWSNRPPNKDETGAITQSDIEANIMFESALVNAFNVGDKVRVLEIAQQRSNLTLISAIRSRMFPVKFERRKFIWGRGGGVIPYLRRKLNKSRQQVALFESETKPDIDELEEAREQLSDIEDEYLSTMQKVTTEDPEFASLFSMPTFDPDTIMNCLQSGDLLLQITSAVKQLYLIQLDDRTLDVDSLRLHGSPEDILQAVFASKQSRFQDCERVFLILPGEWSKLPVQSIWLKSVGSDQTPLYMLPDIQSIVFLNGKQSIGQGKRINVVNQEQLSQFDKIEIQSREDFIDAIENAGMIYLTIDKNNVSNPLDQLIYEDNNLQIPISELFNISTNADVLFIKGSIYDETVLIRSLLYTGVSSIIILPENITDDHLEHFIEVFIEEKVTNSPGEAYYNALDALESNDSFLDEALSGFKYYGSGGLDHFQRQEFVEQNFTSTVLKGNYNLQKGDAEWALRYYNSALAMAEETEDAASIKKLHLLRIKAARGASFWGKAIESQTILIDIAGAERDLKLVETGYRNLSVYYYNLDSTANAIGARAKARSMAIVRGDELRAASDDQITATYHEKLKDYNAAETAISRARDLYYDWGEYEPYIISSVYLCRLMLIREDYYKASRFLEDILDNIPNLEEASGHALAIPPELYQHLGLAYEGMTDYENSLRMQSKAIELEGQENSLTTALSHQYIAGLYWKQGRFQEGLDRIRIASEQFSELGLNQYVYLAENTEALIYLSLGDAERALKKAKHALEGAITTGDYRSRSQIEKNIGLIELSSGEVDKAIIRFRRTYKIDKELNSIRGMAYSLLNLGNAYIQTDQADSARKALKTVKNILPQVTDQRIHARTFLGMGLIEIANGAIKEAISNLYLARRIAEDNNIEDLLWRIELARAEAFIKNRKNEEALVSLYSAMEQIEKTRASIAVEGLQTGFMENKGQVYRLAVSILLNEDNTFGALDVVERSRSRTFLDMIQNRSIDHSAGLSVEMQDKVNAISTKLAGIRKEVEYLKTKGAVRTPEEDALFANYTTIIDSLENDYRYLLERIENSHPGYRDITSVTPAPSTQIQTMLKNEEILLEYYLLDEALVIFTLDREGIKAAKVAIKGDSLKTMVENLRMRLKKKLSVQEECIRLYRILIAPIVKRLNDKSHLIIAPTSSLFYLPFALLIEPDGSYIIDHFTLNYVPSANIFSFCRNRVEERSHNEIGKILALGNPDTGLPLESLFFGEKEVSAIKYVYKDVNIYLGEQAKESKLVNFSDSASVVHLACHGEFNSKNPTFSSLFLAPDDEQDGRLEMFEIFDLHLDHCSLVLLSACESGLGGISGGEEIIGFNRAFIYAGAPRVFSSLWKVDDLATAVLVKRFYRNLRAGLSPAESMQSAQRHIRDRINAHPSYWAAFILTGEPTGNLTGASHIN